MEDCSPHASGLCLCHECKPTVRTTVAGVKRLLDSPEQVEVPQSAKKGCMSRHDSGTSDPSEKLLCSSPGSASFQGSLHFLDDTGHDDLVARSSVPKYDDVVISLDVTRYFGDSDDSLLELSDGEEGNSSFTYTEEEIQEILADDCVESEQCLTRKSSLSQNIKGESEKDESSSYSGASVVSKDANAESKIAEKPNDSVSRECFSVSSECSPGPLNGSAGLDENHLQSAQVTRMLFDLDIQELLRLSPIHADDVDECQEDDTSEEPEREASEGIMNDCLESAKTDSSCVLDDSLEGLMSNDWQSLDVDGLGKPPVTSKGVSHFSRHPVGRSTPSFDLARDQRTADESSAPVLLRCPTPFSGIQTQELPKATKSYFSRKLNCLEDDDGESTEADQPSNSIKLSDTAVGQTGQGETTSGKKPGKVIPQEEEERLNQQTRILEVELSQRNISIQTVCIYTKETDSYTKNYPRSNKKPTQRYSFTQWVSRNLVKHNDF